MTFTKVLCAAVLTALSTSAFAADMIVEQQPQPSVAAPVFSWAGAYIGGQAGYGWSKNKFDTEIGGLSLKPDGFVGGLYAGYNHEFGTNAILGLDGDISFSGLKDSVRRSELDVTGSVESKLRWSGALRARAGLASERVLPYIAGGLAFGDIRDLATISYQDASVVLSHSKVRTGWTIGGGADFAATDNLILRLEYRYTDFGNKTHSISYEDLSANYKSKYQAHDLRAGIAYKF